MPSEAEKQQMFQMLAQGLMQHLMPTFQQVAQNVVQQGLQAGMRGVPNHWVTPIQVHRATEENEPGDFKPVQTTPAQLLAEQCDLLEYGIAQLEELNENLTELNGHLRRGGKGKGRRRQQ
jgi:hypothetical protein